MILSLLVNGCSDAHLYGIGLEDPSPDRLGLTGRVCTVDAREAGFPVKVLMLVDSAQGPLFSDYDPEILRVQAVRDTISVHQGNADFSFAIVNVAGTAQQLAPTDGTYFTQNPGDLEAAVGQLSVAGGCVAGTCRDYDGAFGLAQSIIEGDLATLNAGERARTQYVVVGMMAGPPDPLECYESCCDPDDTACGDTCTEDWPCTLTTYRDHVSDLRQEVSDGGGLSMSFHSMFLFATDPSDKTYNANLLETEQLLEEMAFVGGGSFERFNTADGITMERIGLLKISQLLETKTLMVTNRSVIPTSTGTVADSDGDGLGDAFEEFTLTTDKHKPDTDEDGLTDAIERFISFDPLTFDPTPEACEDEAGPPFADSDLDGMNNCEELLLGTDPTLPDTDGDGIIDTSEVLYGTDYIRDDVLDDSDQDGTTNGDELLNHTQPRSSDANSHLSESYRYSLTDEGFISEPTVYDPRDVTGVTVLSAGVDSTGGLGTLRYIPGSVNRLSWQDASDESPGPVVDIPEAGVYALPSSSVSQQGLYRELSVSVEPALFPPNETSERILVDLATRHCMSFTVRNIKLMHTTEADGPGGLNDIYMYLSQAPEGDLTSPGLFRAVHIPVVYEEGVGRTPSEPLVEIEDGEFTSIGF